MSLVSLPDSSCTCTCIIALDNLQLVVSLAAAAAVAVHRRHVIYRAGVVQCRAAGDVECGLSISNNFVLPSASSCEQHPSSRRFKNVGIATWVLGAAVGSH